MPDDSRNQSQQPALQTAREEPRTIADIIKSKNTIERFKQIMPRHLSSERMMRVCAMAVNNTPLLGKCEAISLLGAMMACASFGLEPNTPLGHAYLIPFKKSKKEGNKWVETYTVQLIIGYRGYIDLARRSGSMVNIHADVVYPGDEFSFEYGSKQHLRHVPKGERTKPIWAYAHATLTDGGEAFEVLPWAEVLEIRNGSQGYQAACAARDEAKGDLKKAYRMKAYESSPWVAHEHEMAAKTMIRRLAKYLPMSLEFMTAVAADTAGDRGTLDLTAISIDPEALKAGEVVETPDEEEGEPAQVEQKTDLKTELKNLKDKGYVDHTSGLSAEEQARHNVNVGEERTAAEQTQDAKADAKPADEGTTSPKPATAKSTKKVTKPLFTQ